MRLDYTANFGDEPPLIKTVFNGEFELAKQLIDEKCDVNCRGAEGMTALHAAAFCWETRFVKLLLEAKARVNAHDKRYHTPLHRACASGASSCVEILLKYNAEVNIRGAKYQTPLHLCAANNYTECAIHLFSHNADVNVSDCLGQTPLHHAARNGHLDMVKLLIQKDASVAAHDKKERRALHWAAAYGHVQVVEYLLEHGSTVTWRDKQMNTPLHVACAMGCVEVVRKLITLGADLDARNEQGDSPLHLACLNGYSHVVEELVSTIRARRGFTGNTTNPQESRSHLLNMENYLGHTPLHLASTSTNGDACLKCLLGERDVIDVHKAATIDGRTPLHMTAVHGRHSRAVALLAEGAEVNARDKEGNTCLHIASRRGHDLYVKTLLERGASTQITGEMGLYPLHMAALHGYNACLKYLLFAPDVPDFKAYLQVCDSLGRNVIHAAAAGGSLECLELVLSSVLTCAQLEESEASVLIAKLVAQRDAHGRSPLHWAAIHSHVNVAMKLMNLMPSEVKSADKLGFTPLHCVVNGERCDEKLVKNLLKEGANPSATTGPVDVWKEANGILPCKECLQPLHLAAYHGHTNALHLLMSRMTSRQLQNSLLEQSISPIHLAAYQGHHESVAAFLHKLVDCRDAKDLISRTPLHLAAYRGHTQCCLTLLNFGADFLLQDGIYRWTPLHYAASQGQVNCVDLLYNALKSENLSVDLLDEHRRTPLMLAVQNGYTEVATLLVSCGANVNMRDTYGRTCLHRAAANGHEACVEMLLGNGKPTSQSNGPVSPGVEVTACDFRGRNALHLAATCGNVGTLMQVLKAEDNLILSGGASEMSLMMGKGVVADLKGFTPLHLAAYNGHDACVQVLLEHPLYGTIMGHQFSPLHCSLMNGNDSCTELLLASLEVLAELGSTCGGPPPSTVSEEEPVPRAPLASNAIHHLLRLQDAQQRSPLHAAAFCEQSTGLELLLKWILAAATKAVAAVAEAGDDDVEACESALLQTVINCRDARGRTPLIFAASYGKEAAVNSFSMVAPWIDWTVNNDRAQNVLHCAAEAADDNVGLALLESLPDDLSYLVNSPDEDGATPVHLACRQGLPHYLRRLVERGGDVFVSDKSLRFPALYCAPTPGLEECLRLCLSVMFFGTGGGPKQPGTGAADGLMAVLGATWGQERAGSLTTALMGSVPGQGLGMGVTIDRPEPNDDDSVVSSEGSDMLY